MPHVVTVTLNPTIDKSCSAPRVVPEHKLRCSEPHFDPGGGGINVARAICYLGGEALALWSCGGPLGELLRDLLVRDALPQQAVSIADMTRENLIVYEESSTQQYRFGMPGPRLSDAEVAHWLDVIAALDPVPDYLVASGSLPPGVPDDFYAQMIARLPKSCRVIVDTSGEALRRSLAAGVFLVKPNLRELGQLHGAPIDNDEQLRSVARTLVERGQAEAVVVSIGSGGAVLVSRAGVEQFRSPTVPIRSKVGAGDSMVGGLTLGLLRGLPLREATRFGIAAGAAAVMTPGTQLCRREDTERLYAQLED